MAATPGRSGIVTRPPSAARRPPALQLLVAGVVGFLAVVPLAYLLLRAVDGGLDAWQPVLRLRTVELVVSTLSLALAVAAGALGLGVPLAWLTTRSDLPARRIWSVLAVAPLAIPSYLLAFSFVGALAPRGWLASWLGPVVGGTPNAYGFGGAALVLILATTPFVVIATRAAFMRLDAATAEAARSLGDGPWAAARAAVLPVVLPAAGAGALLASLYAISDFGAVSILRYDTLATAVYSQYRFSFDRSSAAALAILLVALALTLVWAEGRVRRRSSRSLPQGRRRPPHSVHLGWWRIPALAFCAGVAALSLAVPGVTIVTWLASTLRGSPALSSTAEALGSSLILGGAAAVVAVVVGAPLAALVTYHPGRWSGLSERLLYVLYAIPGISLALAVVSFTLNVTPDLYQTFLVLVLAITMRFLVQAVGSLRSSLSRISPRTLEAARSLGEPTLGVLWAITLPLLRPGLVAGIALVFLSALKELPLTLILAPIGFRTLAVELWDAARDAQYGDAAIPALLLLLVSVLSVGVLYRRGELET